MCALQYVILVLFPTLRNDSVFFTQQHCLAQQSSQHTCMPHSHFLKITSPACHPVCVWGIISPDTLCPCERWQRISGRRSEYLLILWILWWCFFFSLPSCQLFSTHKYFGRILSDHLSVNGKKKKKKRERRSLLDSDQNRLAVSSWVQFSGRQLILSLVRHLRWPVNKYFIFFQVDLMSAAGENTVRLNSSEVETFGLEMEGSACGCQDEHVARMSRWGQRKQHGCCHLTLDIVFIWRLEGWREQPWLTVTVSQDPDISAQKWCQTGKAGLFAAAGVKWNLWFRCCLKFLPSFCFSFAEKPLCFSHRSRSKCNCRGIYPLSCLTVVSFPSWTHCDSFQRWFAQFKIFPFYLQQFFTQGNHSGG